MPPSGEFSVQQAEAVLYLSDIQYFLLDSVIYGADPAAGHGQNVMIQVVRKVESLNPSN